jgi:hypothetical protein
MEGRVSVGGHALETVASRVESWQRAGATHVSLNTMGAGFASVDAHLEVLARVADALDLAVLRD